MSGPPGSRRLVLLAAGEDAAQQWLLRRFPAGLPAGTLWIAERAPPGVVATPAAQALRHLGSECRLLVFNAHQGLHPDGFAAAVGTLRGGGDCVVLAPPLAEWQTFADPDQARFAAYPHRARDMAGHFLARLQRIWQGHAAVRVVTTDSALVPRVAAEAEAHAAVQLSEMQLQVVAAIERVAHGHAGRPLVLTADRGRGKSTALGVAAARLLAAGLPRISVVAAGRGAAETLLRHAAAGLPGGADAQRLRFMRPAECLAEAGHDLGLVLVDEAASVPVATLEALLERSRRLVFASTVHGYEGSGRGFELRFAARLARRMPQTRRMRLSEPVRWAAGDPLEDLLNRSLLLDAGLPELGTAAAAEPLIEQVDAAQLAADEGLLRQVFGLLVAAHYQTRPSDLRQLLDNPDLCLWLARVDGVVAGVVLLGREGGFDAAMQEQVLDGRRRPRGHLLAQSLAVHAGLDDCLHLRLLRVQRIAVHPAWQRRGLAGAMLDAAAARATAAGFDLLGCAFGLEPWLLAFWRAVGFEPVRLGVRVDPASAGHSLFMLRALGDAGEALLAQARHDFLAALPWSLGASLVDLDSALAVELLRGRRCADIALSAAERLALRRLAAGARQPATAESTLWKALLRLAADGVVQPQRLAPLFAWQVQRRPLRQVARSFGKRGRKALEDELRSLLAQHEAHLLSSG
jgi:tRNA(Met) cytidine acetyltransferase